MIPNKALCRVQLSRRSWEKLLQSCGGGKKVGAGAGQARFLIGTDRAGPITCHG